MDKRVILKNLFNKPEVKDYTYIIFFLIIFSAFAFFIIKPSLTIAFSLRREASDLKKVREIYETNNAKLVSIQTALESLRDKTNLLDEAIPPTAQTKTIIDNIRTAAVGAGISINNLSMSSVDLKSNIKSNEHKKVSISMTTEGKFPDLQSFIRSIINQRRIKTITDLRISKANPTSTQSGTLKVVIEFEGYYL